MGGIQTFIKHSSSAPHVRWYNYFILHCHLGPLSHPTDTTTPLHAVLIFAYQNLVARQWSRTVPIEYLFLCQLPKQHCGHVNSTNVGNQFQCFLVSCNNYINLGTTTQTLVATSYEKTAV